ncbi:MAG: AMP-binding protein [Polyangiaceae bacterium]
MAIASRFLRSIEGGLELMRLGSLAPAPGQPYEIRAEGPHFRLRHYGVGGEATSGPLLLVPPLMLTAEVYDIAPDVSAVATLRDLGMDPWVVDFGAPEREAGGMTRTLDDHVRAVAEAIAQVRDLTGRDVHVGGYSQGGMFAYQACALSRGEGVASLVTMGSPVDIHRSVPQVGDEVISRLLRSVAPMVDLPLSRIEGLPGILTSYGFKLLTPKKEAEQLLLFLKSLHDRQALARRASRRRFLAGEGFVAWPGPALRAFFDELIVHNRMVAGGLVIDGRTITLADIRCPVLYFIGRRDDLARPAAVRAIAEVAVNAECHEVMLGAGHFGLVVGRLAKAETWPTIAEWIRWREGEGPEPRRLREARPVVEEPAHDEPEELIDIDVDFKLVTDEIGARVGRVWRRLGDAYRSTSDTLHGLRHQLPRLWQLETLEPDTRISASLALAERARATPEATFFLWRGRAYTYAEAHARVDEMAGQLAGCGARSGQRVGVRMAAGPAQLAAVTALVRLGAVAVVASPGVDDGALAAAFAAEGVSATICDVAQLERARRSGPGPRWVVGVPASRQWATLELGPDEQWLAAARAEPCERPDPGCASDLGLILIRPGRGGARVAAISHGRWAFSALGIASAATLTPEDTVYNCLPLHHPTGIMVAVGGALVSGARLALAEGFDPASFWSDLHRYGVTVVFYGGEMLRPVADAPRERTALRLVAGSGMRADLGRRIEERLGVGVLEIYASTEKRLVLVNASGEKRGALGRRLPGSAEVALLRYDLARGELVLREGRALRAEVDEAGLLVARLEPGETAPHGEVREDLLDPGDRWLVTKDLLRRDRDGDYWYVDRVDSALAHPDGIVAMPHLEDALYTVPGVTRCLASTFEGEPWALVVSADALDSAVVTRRLRAALATHEQPKRILRVAAIAETEAFRPIRTSLTAVAASRDGVIEELAWTPEGYRRDALSRPASSSPPGVAP